MDSALLNVIAVASTGLLGFLGTMYKDRRRERREDRQRQWDREDRAETRAVAHDLKAHAQKVERVTDAQTGQLLAAVEDGNQKTTYALDTANGFNGKIAQLHERMDTFETILREISRMMELDEERRRPRRD